MPQSESHYQPQYIEIIFPRSAGHYRWYKDNYITSTIIIDLVGESRRCDCNGRSETCDSETGMCQVCGGPGVSRFVSLHKDHNKTNPLSTQNWQIHACSLICYKSSKKMFQQLTGCKMKSMSSFTDRHTD